MTTIITPIAAGDAYDDVKAALVSLAEFWLGSGASSGGNTPVTWADIRTSLNAIATVLGVDTISNGDGGAAARAKINAINDLATLPSIGDLLTRFTTPASDDRAKLIGKLIYNLKDGGVWSKLDVLYLTAAADTQAARRNWIADIYNLTAVNSPTHTADRGYTGNGSSAYLDTGFNLATADAGAANYKRNSAVLGGWNRTSRAGAATGLMGVSRTVGSFVCDLVPRFTDNNAYIRANASVYTDKFASTESAGHFTARRSAGNTASMFKNGVLQASTGSASSVPPSNTMTLLATRIDGTVSLFSSDQIAASYMGGYLTDAELAGLHAAMNTYLTAIGAA